MVLPCDASVAADGFVVAAVVFHVHHQRVVVFAVVLERLHDPADTLIHVVNHGGVYLHASRLALLVWHFVPFAPFRAEVPFRIVQPHLLEPLEAGFSDGLIAAIVFPLVFGNVLFQRLHGPMSGRVGNIEEKRLIGMGMAMIPDEPAGMIAQRVGIVIRLRLIVWIAKRADRRIVLAEHAGIEKVSAADDGAVEARKAALHWPVVFGAVGFLSLIHI